MAKEKDNSIGMCPNCGEPLYEENKKMVDIWGILNGEQAVIDTKEVYHCNKCGAEPRTQELR